jgi:hypothetical protein
VGCLLLCEWVDALAVTVVVAVKLVAWVAQPKVMRLLVMQRHNTRY